MLNKKHSEYFKVRTYDADFTRKATPTSIHGFMQDIATNHAERLGLGYKESMNNGYFWVLRSSKYELDRLPKLNEVIELKTWPAGIVGLKALRRFSFIINGEVIGRGFNYWLMMDKDKHKPIISNYFVNVTNKLNIIKEDYFKLSKIAVPEGLDFSYEKTIRNKDIDWNQHVNNVRYVDIIFDAIPFDIINNKQIFSFHIDYLKESKIDDIIKVLNKIENNKIFVVGFKNNEMIFKSVLHFKD